MKEDTVVRLKKQIEESAAPQLVNAAVMGVAVALIALPVLILLTITFKILF